MDYLSNNVAVNLKRIRKSKSMSLDQVSEQTGVSKSMLAQIERGTANPSLGVLGKIYKWSEDRVSGADTAAESGLLFGDTDLAGNAKKVGDYFAAKLEKLPHVKEVRHQGLLVGVEFDDTIGGVDVKHGCLDRHLLITAIGAHIIRMIPPLIVTEEECDKAVAIIEDTIKSLGKIKSGNGVIQ